MNLTIETPFIILFMALYILVTVRRAVQLERLNKVLEERVGRYIEDLDEIEGKFLKVAEGMTDQVVELLNKRL